VGKGIAGRTLSSGRWSRNVLFSNSVWPFTKEEYKQSTISLKKAGLVHDLVEKLWLGNGLVYELGEIDNVSI